MNLLKDYYTLQYKYKKNFVVLVIEFGEGNQIKIKGSGKESKNYIQPCLNDNKKGIILR